MANTKNNWQELKAIIISAVLLGFIFGFDDGSVIFNLVFWIKNLIFQIVMSLIFIMIFVKITKYYSQRKGITTNFSLWNIKRHGFSRSSTYQSKGFPAWLILPTIISVLSAGKLFFSAVLCPEFKTTPSSRLGMKYEKATDHELALISLAGPLVLTIIGIFVSRLGPEFSAIALIPFSIAFSSLIPISKLNGATALGGSPTMYIFTLAFVITSFYVGPLFTLTSSLVVGALVSLILMTSFYFYIYVK